MSDSAVVPLRTLHLPDWPELHRRAWAAACAEGRLLGQAGLAAKWRPDSRTKTLKGFGYWLNWARDQSYNRDDSLPVLVTLERAVAYIEQLRPGRASFTVSCYVQELYDAVRVMAPAHDWGWLAGIHRAVRAEAIPERDKLGRLRPAHEIEALGLRLMQEAETAEGWSDQRRAVQFRDGLMITLLIRRLLRLRNFTDLRLGEHIVRLSGVWMLRLGRHETKGHRPLDVLVPRVVIEGLERYLGHHRRVLLRGEGAGQQDEPHDHDTLWVSEVGTPLDERSLHGRIRKHTSKAFGDAIPPHWFRDAGVTEFILHAPKQALDSMHLLIHATPDMAFKHYNQAMSIEASRRHVAMMEAMRLEALDAEELD